MGRIDDSLQFASLWRTDVNHTKRVYMCIYTGFGESGKKTTQKKKKKTGTEEKQREKKYK